MATAGLPDETASDDDTDEPAPAPDVGGDHGEDDEDNTAEPDRTAEPDEPDAADEATPQPTPDASGDEDLEHPPPC